MALDEALLSRARRTGEGVLRLYTWSRPTLSLGRHQTARGRYRIERLRALGIDVVRRPTGGRAVLHDREITYSVTAPCARAGPLRESYDRINRLLVVGLAELGVHVAPASQTTSRAPLPGVRPCFETPTAGELIWGGRKLVGSAQWRDREVMLQHGSILLDDDQSLVGTLLKQPEPSPMRPATLREALGRSPTLDEITTAMTHAVRMLEDRAVAPLAIDHRLSREIARARARYEDDDWTWRR